MRKHVSVIGMILIMSLIFALNSFYCEAYSKEPSSWAADAVLELRCSGISTDAVNDSYDKNITRKEFVLVTMNSYLKAKNISTLKYLAGASIVAFKDSGSSDDISAAYRLGVVSGYPDGTFRPNGEITREEACVMLGKFIKALKPETQIDMNGWVDFHDGKEISSWARPYVVFCYKKGIMSGTSDLVMSPKSKITREQYFTMIYRFAVANGILEKRQTRIKDLDYFPISEFKVPKNSKLIVFYPSLDKGQLLRIRNTSVDYSYLDELKDILSSKVDPVTVNKMIIAIRESRGYTDKMTTFPTLKYDINLSYGFENNEWYWEVTVLLHKNN